LPKEIRFTKLHQETKPLLTLQIELKNQNNFKT
jgi:hypothetical protein